MTIISLEAARKRKEDRSAPPIEFVVTSYRDGWFLEGTACSSDPDTRLVVANQLRSLARLLDEKSTELRGDPPNEVLADIQIYESGRVRAWQSERIETQEQVEWALRQAADAPLEHQVGGGDGRDKTPE